MKSCRILHLNSIGRRGLTLIELMASVLLLSILMAALSGIIPRFVRQGIQAEQRRQENDHWMFATLQRMVDDLGNAEKGFVSENHLHLIGRLHRDPATGQMTDQDASVSYWLQTWGQRTLILVRSGDQTSLLGCGDVQLILEHLTDNEEVAGVRLAAAPARVDQLHPFLFSPAMRMSLVASTGEILQARVVVRQPSLPEGMMEMAGDKE